MEGAYGRDHRHPLGTQDDQREDSWSMKLPTHGPSPRLCQPVGNFPLWIQWKFPYVAKEPGLTQGGASPPPTLPTLSPPSGLRSPGDHGPPQGDVE